MVPVYSTGYLMPFRRPEVLSQDARMLPLNIGERHFDDGTYDLVIHSPKTNRLNHMRHGYLLLETLKLVTGVKQPEIFFENGCWYYQFADLVLRETQDGYELHQPNQINKEDLFASVEEKLWQDSVLSNRVNEKFVQQNRCSHLFAFCETKEDDSLINVLLAQPILSKELNFNDYVNEEKCYENKRTVFLKNKTDFKQQAVELAKEKRELIKNITTKVEYYHKKQAIYSKKSKTTVGKVLAFIGLSYITGIKRASDKQKALQALKNMLTTDLVNAKRLHEEYNNEASLAFAGGLFGKCSTERSFVRANQLAEREEHLQSMAAAAA